MAVDGFNGELLIEPTADELVKIERRVALDVDEGRRAAELRGRGGATRDGHAVRLLANLGGPGEVERALLMGAEGVGLLRTEFLFLGRSGPRPRTTRPGRIGASSPRSGPTVRSSSGWPISGATRRSRTSALPLKRTRSWGSAGSASPAPGRTC